ncbi:MAG: NADPH-dependent aldehyde reductase Ahr [Myxococcota bacterium]
MTTFRGYAAREPGGALSPLEFDPGPMGDDDVEVLVHSCGICHSDLSMIDNAWGMTNYPLVPGHEVVGEVVAVGAHAKNVQVGQRVGLGWFSGSCMHCAQCLDGHHNLCDTVESTIVGRHGGFADRVRCHWAWALALPEGIDAESAGPLFCGGLTVFNPMEQFDVSPTDRVGVVGIGGLGHLGLQFLSKWGCHVTAFTSTEGKAKEALAFGADEVLDSRDDDALSIAAGTLDFLLVTVNAPLNWDAYIAMLKPRGRMHFVGAVPEPIPVAAFTLIGSQRQLSGSPVGSPSTTARMLDFCKRHQIRPQIETFPMRKVNEALDRLRSGQARYRIVLVNEG